MRNTHPRFHASFLKTILWNPNPCSCFIFCIPKPFPPHSYEPWSTQTPFRVPKPFPPHSWEPWSTQPLFHASFLDVTKHSHNTFGNHFEPSQALPTPLLWAMKYLTPVFMLHPTLGRHEAPKLFFMLHFPSPSHPTLGNHQLFLMLQTLPTPLLGTMRNTQPPFHASFLAFPNPSPPHSWEPWETPNPLFMLHFLPSQTLPTLGNHEKHPPPFSCFIFTHHSWEPWETPPPLFMLHF